MAWHSLETKQVFEELNSSESGLTMDEASRRLKEYGYNEVHQEETGSV